VPVGLEGGALSADDERSLHREMRGGRPLGRAARGPMESAFGADFSSVRVHTGAATDALAQRISARAFTVGSDVFVRSSDYRPETPAGTRLLAHELAHTIQQGGGKIRRAGRGGSGQAALVQRQAITREDFLDMFADIRGLRDLFTDDAASAGPQGVSVVNQASRMLSNYEDLFEGSAPSDVVANAMKLAAAARAIGAMLARAMNNPWTAPELSQKLLAYYRPSILRRLKDAGVGHADRSAALNLAGVVASADPVKLYMTDKISVADATRKIQQMAVDAGGTAAQMHGYLEQQFQMELRSFTAAEITAGTIGEGVAQDANTVSGEAELIGELSTRQFNSLVNTQLFASGRTWAAVNGLGNGLDFKAPAAAKLLALQQAVANAAPLGAVAPIPAVGPGAQGLSDRQKQEIGGFDAADAAAMHGGVTAQIIDALVAEFNVDRGGAARLLQSFVDTFRAMPLTTTFFAVGMFGTAVAGGLEYQNAMKRELARVQLRDLFPTRSDAVEAAGDVEKVGANHGMAEHRGNVNYVRWRFEKDVKPPGYGGLSIADTFEFGAISPGFAAAKGSEDTVEFGKNQYGDSHVVYKDDVKDRAVYQFTAKGALRRDPLLLLHDIAVGAPAARAAAQAAWQRAKDEYDLEAPNTPARALKMLALQQADIVLNTAKSKDVQAGNVLKSIFASIAAKKLAYIDQQQIEVRIFGRVNFATDAKELHVGNAADQAVKDNAKAFAKANGIKFAVVKPGSAEIRSDMSRAQSADLNLQVSQFLAKGSDRKAARFDALATIVLGIQRVKNAEVNMFTALVAEVQALYNALGKTRTAARGQVWTAVQNHAPVIV
jgi:hypothetical protein